MLARSTTRTPAGRWPASLHDAAGRRCPAGRCPWTSSTTGVIHRSSSSHDENPAAARRRRPTPAYQGSASILSETRTCAPARGTASGSSRGWRRPCACATRKNRPSPPCPASMLKLIEASSRAVFVEASCSRRPRRNHQYKSPLVSMRLSNRSDGSLNGFRSLPLESLTLRSLPSIAVRRPRRRLLELSSESLELCGSAIDALRPTRRSRVVSVLLITDPQGPEQARARPLHACARVSGYAGAGFAKSQKCSARVCCLCKPSKGYRRT